ncbi:CDP-alcohol phosphatidyltransferase family protein [Butyrivibrio sp. YAB3001]|uniref:CDP-alcohol phosphatidyltransferase family protein n=1 Tax=Butyrivibrio sp. YAB3001 TaxID=1520812 RepID=UPI0008F621A9|nr:CDP-alcohol phosphatidyltransferase family protein [Butyrivibrio sp. YAB3001]SFC99506.1 CDP-diacylglycerol---serine O-phosphatidyltransferase [Butyrivibrio sp. YAB3001]
MIGVYDYTVILTYLSLVSGTLGIIVTVTGVGHPELGVFFLMVSGLLDAFDGRVARTKKNRSQIEKDFGIQIDSLTDLICFGVLPVTIGLAQLRISGVYTEVVRRKDYDGSYPILIILLTIAIFYVLAALIRLAYFNATSEIRCEESKKTGVTYYMGLPVTAAALVFPLVMNIHFFSNWDITYFYFLTMLIVAIAFVINIKVRKPGKIGLTIIIVIGLAEFIASIIAFNMYT